MISCSRLGHLFFLSTVAAVCPASAQEFEAFHLKSGMTVEQVQKAAPSPYELCFDKQQASPGWLSGYTVKPLSDLQDDDSDIYAAFAMEDS
jgi:hypothetical protein